MGQRVGPWAVLACLLLVGPVASGRVRYGFYRDMWRAGSGAGRARRVGPPEPEGAEGAAGAVALLDRYWAVRCSGAWLAPRWVLTAAHCVLPHLAYVRYNARRPADRDGGIATIVYLFRHPEFRVVQDDDGDGEDVVRLQHDVGLVSTREEMALPEEPWPPPLEAMAAAPGVRPGDWLRLLGFGGERLGEVRLRAGPCPRRKSAWRHVACAGPPGGLGAGAACGADSGGPALLGGAQVALASLGPLQCFLPSAAQPPPGAVTVLTLTRPYLPLLNATMRAAGGVLARRGRSAAPPARPPPLLLAALPLLAR